MKISIIIPTLNEAAGIECCLQRAWATNPHEVVVVDGGSMDGTVELASRLDCRFFRSPRGRAAQQNYGAAQSTGDVLLFLHADNWLAPGGLGQIEKALANPRVGAGAFFQGIEADGILYRMIERGNYLRARILRMAYGDQGIFIRRAAFCEIGGFPNVQLMEDVLLVRRLRRRTSLQVLPGPLYVSPRRWQRHGPIRQTMHNWMLMMAESAGVSPNRLARYYPPQNGDVTNGN